MASFFAELRVAGQSFPVLHCSFGVEQATHQRGRVSTKVRYGPVQLMLDVPEGDLLPGWANDAQKRQPAQVLFRASAGGSVVETLALKAAYCVRYHEQFVHGDAQGGAYQCQLTLSDPDGWTLTAGGPATAFVAPAAREHGLPVAGAVRSMAIGGAMAAASVAAPFVLGADGVPRLPLIKGDPPFKCKGAEKGKKGKPDKPALDPQEFERQLTGQQQGLNKLTVAAFIANRDQYVQLSKENKAKNNKNGGRNLKEGNPAQELARKKAFEAKFDELRQQDPSLTDDQAEIDTNKWLETQSALHDPDQVAGGYAAHITGMGDERVNSSIGGGWPSRIKAIDKQIRDYAKNMTPEEQQNTYLNIVLPFTKPVI